MLDLAPHVLRILSEFDGHILLEPLNFAPLAAWHAACIGNETRSTFNGREPSMQFWKMNGAGNDFIILNNLQEGLSADCFPALARRLCEPPVHWGGRSDGGGAAAVRR